MLWLGAAIAQVSTAADPFIVLLQYGVLGAVVMALITGWLWPKPSVTRMQLERDEIVRRLIEERNVLDTKLSELMEQRNELARQMTQQVSSLQSEMSGIKGELEDMSHMMEKLTLQTTPRQQSTRQGQTRR